VPATQPCRGKERAVVAPNALRAAAIGATTSFTSGHGIRLRFALKVTVPRFQERSAHDDEMVCDRDLLRGRLAIAQGSTPRRGPAGAK
jgi:hypothetical protein